MCLQPKSRKKEKDHNIDKGHKKVKYLELM